MSSQKQREELIALRIKKRKRQAHDDELLQLLEIKKERLQAGQMGNAQKEQELAPQ